MLLMVLAGLVALLITLLSIHLLPAQPRASAASADGVRSVPLPPPTAGHHPENQMAAMPSSRAEVIHVGPSTGRVALGVFLGLWMFTISAALIAITVAALLIEGFPEPVR